MCPTSRSYSPVALITNMQLFSGTLLIGQYWNVTSGQLDAGVPEAAGHATFQLARDGILPLIGHVSGQSQLDDGLLYLIDAADCVGSTTPQSIGHSLRRPPRPYLHIPEWVHAIVYILFLAAISVVFGLFWVETANMDAKSVADAALGIGHTDTRASGGIRGCSRRSSTSTSSRSR